MSKDSELVLPNYIYFNLAEYKNAVIARKYLIQYGSEQIIEECKNKGYCVKLVRVSHTRMSVVNRRATKQPKYPVDDSYILEIV